MPSRSAGYSGTPLAKKLGIKADHRIATLHEPPEFASLVDLPDGADLHGELADAPDGVIAFFTERATLLRDLPDIEVAIEPDRFAWVAWPKKTSGIVTDLTGDVVRADVLTTRLVDVKVCAISDVWSGLKVVWRTEHR